MPPHGHERLIARRNIQETSPLDQATFSQKKRYGHAVKSALCTPLRGPRWFHLSFLSYTNKSSTNTKGREGKGREGALPIPSRSGVGVGVSMSNTCRGHPPTHNQPIKKELCTQYLCINCVHSTFTHMKRPVCKNLMAGFCCIACVQCCLPHKTN